MERIPLLKNCIKDIPYDLMTPPCPRQPYKVNFAKLSSPKTKTKTKSYTNTKPQDKYSQKNEIGVKKEKIE